jgi:AraC family transcriptional regulator
MTIEVLNATEQKVVSKVSPGSLLAHAEVPSLRQQSSRSLGWRSLLVDIHSGVASHESYTSVPTPDLRIGVTLFGGFGCDSLSGKYWRQDTFTPGSIMLHHTSEPSTYRFPKPRDENYRLGLIYIPEDLVLAADEQLRRIGAPAGVPTFRSALGRDRAIYEVALALEESMSRDGGDLYAEATAHWLVMHILRRYGSHSSYEENRSAGEISDARLVRVLEFMSANYAESLTLESLAAEACISKFHFVRLFKEKTGHSPIQHLSDLRVRAARRLLLSSDLPVADIARGCGFASASHLGTQFANRYGLTPSRYRALSESESSLVVGH